MKGASIKILSILLAIGILYPSLAPIVALAAPVTLDKASPVNMGICYDKNGKQIGSVPLMPDACKSSGGVTMDQAISPSNPAGKPVAKSSGGSILEKTAGCSAWNLVGYDLFECLIQVIDYVAYGVVYYIAGWITGIAGNALSYTLGLTINNKFYTNINAITAGWEFSRDIVNIFFIFAILLIAIATILGIESYGAKKLLATLIIAALLVNFSLLATQAIIFVTNALTYELYNSVNSKIAPSSLLQSADPGFRKDISAELMSGLLQQKIFASNPGTTYAGAAALAAPTSQFQINMAVLVTIVAAAFIMIFAAFIFLAGAFFFIARMAMLWILMVVAPFGFVLLVLPATKGYAQKWWLTLQSQAFFAPAFMFFILITIKMVQSDPLGLMGKIKSLGGSPPTTDLLFLLILQNMVIFIFLGASLLVAKAAGIYGADGAMKMAQKGGQWFRGATGRMAMAPVRGARQAAAPLAEKVARSPLGRIPFLGRGAANIAASERKAAAEYQKSIESLNSDELKNQLGSPRINPTKSKGIINELVKRGDISFKGGLTPDRLRAVHREMGRVGENTRDLERLWPELAVSQSVSDALRKAPATDRFRDLDPATGPSAMKTLRDTARRIRPDDLNKMDDSVADQAHTMDAVAASLSVGSAQAAFNRGGRIHQGISDAIKRLNQARTGHAIGAGPLTTAQRTEVAATLRALGNNSLANWIENAPIGQAFM